MPRPDGKALCEYLRSVRKEIAKANGIVGYVGSSDQNTQLLSLLKAGKRMGMCTACFDGKYPTELYTINKDEE